MEKLTCDSCGDKIKDVQDGWVEWLCFEGDKTGQGLRVVHKNSRNNSLCQYNQNDEYAKSGGTLLDNALKEFIGCDGLMRLLVMISENEVCKEEVLEMIKRLHISGYDQAKSHFDAAISNGVFEPSWPKGYYDQDNIKETIKYKDSLTAESWSVA